MHYYGCQKTLIVQRYGAITISENSAENPEYFQTVFVFMILFLTVSSFTTTQNLQVSIDFTIVSDHSLSVISFLITSDRFCPYKF